MRLSLIGGWSTSFMFGVALIVMSVIFRYGAELRVQS